MKILVTGGAGYIGSILVPALLNEGHEVVVLDNFLYGQTSLTDQVINPRLKIIRGDARNEELLKKILPDFNLILPLACLTGAPACDKDPEGSRTLILEGVRFLLKHRRPEQMIIYPNTNSGYGVGQSGIYCSEESPLNPVSLYGRLKVQAEKEILESGNAIALRLATVFGMSPRMRLDLLVNEFVYRAINDRFIVLFEAHFKRNYIHVRDVARAFIHSLENFGSLKNEVYNVGLSSANLSKWELCQEIKKQIPNFYFVEAEIGKDPDQRNYIVSNEKIEKTGFTPKIGLEEGIGELIKGFQIIRRNQFTNL